jgi:hypothetical protein
VRAWEQVAHGGVDGRMRHLTSGSAPEQPVPRKMSDDAGAAASTASPSGGAMAAACIGGRRLLWKREVLVLVGVAFLVSLPGRLVPVGAASPN